MIRNILAVTVLAAAMAAPASADRFVATFTGTVTNGSDSHNVFGQDGADLAGQDFTAVFTLDDGAADTYIQNGSVYYGVYNSGPASPIHATLTIGGVTYNYGPATDTYSNYLAWTRYPGGTFDQFMGNVTTYSDNGTVSTSSGIQLYGNTSLDDYLGSPLDYHVPFTKEFSSDSGGTVSFSQSYDGNADYIYDEEIGLRVTRITYAAAPAAVPEPASWAMMLVGFGLAGSAMRRRIVAVRFA
jgi:hypothetical protein